MAQGTSSQFQTPSSKEAPSSKLKNRPARRLPRHLFLAFDVLRFGTSLELGVWCLVFRSAVAQELRCPLSAPLLGGLGVGSGSQCAASKSRVLSKSGIQLTRSGASRFSRSDYLRRSNQGARPFGPPATLWVCRPHRIAARTGSIRLCHHNIAARQSGV